MGGVCPIIVIDSSLLVCQASSVTMDEELNQCGHEIQESQAWRS